MGILEGKRALITGVASQRSIAYGVAKAMRAQGAQVALTYQTERLKERVHRLGNDLGSEVVVPCDVCDDAQINQLCDRIAQHWDGLDILVHSIAYAPREMLEGDYLAHLDRAGFIQAHDISSYSFAALAKAALGLMHRNAALLTMTYIGATRSIPNYNVMGVAKASLEANVRYLAQCMGPEGIRVNAVSAGPIKTLAASGIKGFKNMLQYSAQVAPLRTHVTIEQVGNASAFLCSDLASGITGEILHVDAGFHSTGGIPQNPTENY